MRTQLHKNSIPTRGFSFVEILTVVALIGVFAAVAVPSIGTVNSSALTAVNQRNAQSIAMVYTEGQGAGVVWPAAKADAIALICSDGVQGTGVFKNQVFCVAGLTPADIAAASDYLDDNVAYIEKGGL